MKRKKLILNAFILTFATMMIGFVSTSFRVYLSNKIGSEGIGLYRTYNEHTCNDNYFSYIWN